MNFGIARQLVANDVMAQAAGTKRIACSVQLLPLMPARQSSP
jgi:hypothetical protein